jgi:hypothetical protein
MANPAAAMAPATIPVRSAIGGWQYQSAARNAPSHPEATMESSSTTLCAQSSAAAIAGSAVIVMYMSNWKNGTVTAGAVAKPSANNSAVPCAPLRARANPT